MQKNIKNAIYSHIGSYQGWEELRSIGNGTLATFLDIEGLNVAFNVSWGEDRPSEQSMQAKYVMQAVLSVRAFSRVVYNGELSEAMDMVDEKKSGMLWSLRQILGGVSIPVEICTAGVRRIDYIRGQRDFLEGDVVGVTADFRITWMEARV